MDKTSGPPEVSQSSAVQPAARSHGSESAADASGTSATAAGEARRHDMSEGSKGVTDAVERSGVSHGEATKATESAATTVAAAGSELRQTSPVPSMNGAGSGERTASPGVHSDEKKSSEATPSTYLEPDGVATVSLEKKPVMEDREERVGPETEQQKVSPSVADKDSAVPSPQKHQQPEEDNRVAEKPARGTDEAKGNGAKETPAKSDQKLDAIQNLDAKTTTSREPTEASSEKKEISEATGKGNEAAEERTIDQPAKSETKSQSEEDIKLSEKPASPSRDAPGLQPVPGGTGDATQPTPDDTRPKSSIPPPPVYETPSRSSTANAEKREHREVEETKSKVNGHPEERVEVLKKDGPKEATQEAEVTESIQAATACYTGIRETTLPGTIQKEVAPREAFSSSGVLNDVLDEEAIKAQLYPSMYEEAPKSSGAETKEPSTAREPEKSVADGLPSYTEALHDVKDQQLNITQKGAAAGKEEPTIQDKADGSTKRRASEVSEHNVASSTGDDVKEIEHDKAAKETLPTSEPLSATKDEKEAAQEEHKPPAEVALSDDDKMRADTSQEKAERTLPQKEADKTGVSEDSAKKEREELKMESDYTREKGMEEGKETERKTTEAFDANRTAPSNAVQETHEPPSKEGPAQVGDVTGDEDKAEKQPEHVQKAETVKDTSETFRDREADIGQQEVETATKESSSTEKEEAKVAVPPEAPSPGELDVQELPPEQVEKELPDGNQTSEEATAEKVSDTVPEDKDKEKKSEPTDEAPAEPAREVDTAGVTESSGKEEAQGIVEVTESLTEKAEGELSVDETAQATEVSETKTVREEAESQDEPTETEKEKDAGQEGAESVEKASEETTSQVDTGQGAAEAADTALSGGAGEEATPGNEEQEAAAADAEAEPAPSEESQPAAAEQAAKEELSEEKKTEEVTDEAAPSELEVTPTAEAVKKKSGLPKSPSKRATSKGPPRSLDKKESPATPDAKAKAPSSPKKPSSIQDKGGPSPKKSAPPKNGATSPSKTARTPGSEQKKLPPIKAPVGQAPKPDLKNVRSKIGSLDNIKHKPKGGEVKVTTQKLEWRAAPKVGSLDNAAHKPGGGDKKIVSQKLDFKAQSKVGSLDNVDHKPTGGQVKVETQKLEFKDKAAPKVGSLDNVKHKAGGGNVEILSEKLEFKERAASKIGSLPASDTGSTRGSESLSPTNMTSPQPPEQSQEDDVTAANGHDESDVSPTKEEAMPASGVPASAPPPEVAQC